MPAPFRGKFPQAILHIDGDAFFASCEQARNPMLRGKPVVVGKERGIAASMSYEAKAYGITRAMRLSDIKRLCPEVIILPSDYETYSLLSKRFYDVVRRYTPDVEEYGIDECFADLTGWERPLKMHPVEIAEKLQADLVWEFGFTFSIGLASTKVLAKIGSKWKKPHGLTPIPNRYIPRYLSKLPVGFVWGIGPSTTIKLQKFGVSTALDFIERDLAWVERFFPKPIQEIWCELRGTSVLPLSTEPREEHFSIQKMKTFTPPSTDPKFVFAQLAKNIESACIKARRYKLEARKVSLLLRTQKFEHQSEELRLSRPTNFAHELIDVIEPIFYSLFRKNTPYRATRIILFDLAAPSLQGDLFDQALRIERLHHLYKSIDRVQEKHGKHTLHSGASFLAHHFAQHLGERGDVAERKLRLLPGETKRRRLAIPVFFGEME